MEFSAVVFHYLFLASGFVCTFAAVLWLLGWALVKTYEHMRVWNVLRLAVAIQLHGSNYRDQLFWRAVKERASSSAFAAQSIVSFVNKHSAEEPPYAPDRDAWGDDDE